MTRGRMPRGVLRKRRLSKVANRLSFPFFFFFFEEEIDVCAEISRRN